MDPSSRSPMRRPSASSAAQVGHHVGVNVKQSAALKAAARKAAAARRIADAAKDGAGKDGVRRAASGDAAGAAEGSAGRPSGASGSDAKSPGGTGSDAASDSRRRYAPAEVVVRPVMGGGAGVPPPPAALPFFDRAAHSRARADLLELISRHAVDELGGGSARRAGASLGGGAVGVAPPPPTLALRELEARKAAAEEEDQARIRRQNAVHALLKKVAEQNEARRAKAAATRPNSAAAEAEDAGGSGRYQRRPGARNAPGVETARDGIDPSTASQRAARRAAARERDKPWRVNIDPSFWEVREAPSATRRAAVNAGDKKDAPPPTWGRPREGPVAADNAKTAGGGNTATTAEDERKRLEADEARKAEVRAFIVKSREKWKQRLVEEKAALRRDVENRVRTKKKEEERGREQAKAAAAARRIRETSEEAAAAREAGWVTTTEISPAKSDEGLDAPSSSSPVPGVPVPTAESKQLQREQEQDEQDERRRQRERERREQDSLVTPTRRPGSKIPGPPRSFKPASSASRGRPDWEDPKPMTPQPSPGVAPRSPLRSPVLFGAAAAAAAVTAAEERRRRDGGPKPAWVMPDLDMPDMPEVLDFQDFVQRRKPSSRAERPRERHPTGKGKVNYPRTNPKGGSGSGSSRQQQRERARERSAGALESDPQSSAAVLRALDAAFAAGGGDDTREEPFGGALFGGGGKGSARGVAWSRPQRERQRPKTAPVQPPDDGDVTAKTAPAASRGPDAREQARLLKDVAKRLAATIDTMAVAVPAASSGGAPPSSSEEKPRRGASPSETLDDESAHASAVVIQSAYRGHVARKRVRAGILRPSRGAGAAGYRHASGRHISFAETVVDADGEGAPPDVEAAAAPRDVVSEAPLPRPRLLGVDSGPPDTHTVLPGGEHVPREEDWLGQGAGGRRRGGLARRRDQDDDLSVDHLDANVNVHSEDGLGETFRQVAPDVNDGEAASTVKPPLPPPPVKPRLDVAAGGVFDVYMSRSAAASSSSVAATDRNTAADATSTERHVAALETKGQQTDPLALVYERTETENDIAATSTSVGPAPGGSPSLASRERQAQVSPVRRREGPSHGREAPGVDEPDETDGSFGGGGDVERHEAASRENRRAAAIAALTAEATHSQDGVDRLTPAELERQLLSELNLFEEMGEMAAELDQVQHAREMFAAEQTAANFAAIVEAQQGSAQQRDALAEAHLARADDLERRHQARAADLERMAMDITARVRDESLAHIKEVTEMFVSSIERQPKHVSNAEAQTSFSESKKHDKENDDVAGGSPLKKSPKSARGTEDGAYSSGFESGSGHSAGRGSDGSDSILDEAPLSAGDRSALSRRSRRGVDREGGEDDDAVDEEDMTAAGGDASGAFGSPTFPGAGGGDTSSILDEVKGLVETMSRYSSSIEDEVGDLGSTGAMRKSREEGNTVAGVEAAAVAAGIDTSNLNEQVAAAFLQAVERQMSEEERVLKAQLAAVDAEVQHAHAAMRSPMSNATERSDARLQHAEAEARRALIAQKIAANRAVYVQQKLISMRMQAARGGSMVLPTAAPLSGVAISTFDSAADSIIERAEGDKAAAARAEAAADAASGDAEDEEIVEEVGILATSPAGRQSEAGRSEAASVQEESMAYTDDFEPLSHANTRVLSDEVVEDDEGLTQRTSPKAGRRPPGFANVHATQEPQQGAAADDSFDEKYRAVTSKHEEVQRRLKARQRELRAAELAAKQARIREMERELAALEAAAAAVVSEDATGVTPRRRLGGGNLSATGEISESIEEAVYSEEFPSDESIEDEMPSIQGGGGAERSSEESIADEISGGQKRSMSSAAEPTVAMDAPLSAYDAEAKLAAHEARIAQLQELVEKKRLEAVALRDIKAREMALHNELHKLDASIDRIESQPMPSPPPAARRSPQAKPRSPPAHPPSPTYIRPPPPQEDEDDIVEDVDVEGSSPGTTSDGYSADFAEEVPSVSEASSGGVDDAAAGASSRRDSTGISEDIEEPSGVSEGSRFDDSHVSVQFSVKSATVSRQKSAAMEPSSGPGADPSRSFDSEGGKSATSAPPSRPRSPVAAAAAALLEKDRSGSAGFSGASFSISGSISEDVLSLSQSAGDGDGSRRSSAGSGGLHAAAGAAVSGAPKSPKMATPPLAPTLPGGSRTSISPAKRPSPVRVTGASFDIEESIEIGSDVEEEIEFEVEDDLDESRGQSSSKTPVRSPKSPGGASPSKKARTTTTTDQHSESLASEPGGPISSSSPAETPTKAPTPSKEISTSSIPEEVVSQSFSSDRSSSSRASSASGASGKSAAGAGVDERAKATSPAVSKPPLKSPTKSPAHTATRSPARSPAKSRSRSASPEARPASPPLEYHDRRPKSPTRTPPKSPMSPGKSPTRTARKSPKSPGSKVTTSPGSAPVKSPAKGTAASSKAASPTRVGTSPSKAASMSMSQEIEEDLDASMGIEENIEEEVEAEMDEERSAAASPSPQRVAPSKSTSLTSPAAQGSPTEDDYSQSFMSDTALSPLPVADSAHSAAAVSESEQASVVEDVSAEFKAETKVELEKKSGGRAVEKTPPKKAEVKEEQVEEQEGEINEMEAILDMISSTLLDEALGEITSAAAAKAGTSFTRMMVEAPTTPSSPEAVPSPSKQLPKAVMAASSASTSLPATSPPSSVTARAPTRPPAPAAPIEAVPSQEELERRAVEKQVGAYAYRILEHSGALTGGLTQQLPSMLDAAAFQSIGPSSASSSSLGRSRTSREDIAAAAKVPDRLIFDTVAEVIAAACPAKDTAGDPGGSSLAAVTAANMGSSLRGERLAEYVMKRVIALITPEHGGREKVDDIVRDDVKASDDSTWYDVRSTEHAIIHRLSEEIWSELVEDTILGGINN